MRIKYDVDNLIIYLKTNEKIDKDALCNKIIDKLKKYYNIKLKGFYDVNIYNDNNNLIIEIIEDNVDVSDYYNRVDLNTRIINTNFLFEIEDILDTDIKCFYIYKDKYYVLFNNIDNKNLEFGKIIYKDIKEILKNGKKYVCK